MTRKRPVRLNLEAELAPKESIVTLRPTGATLASIEKTIRRVAEPSADASHYKVTLPSGESAIYHSEHNRANSHEAATNRRSRYLSGRDGIVKRLTNTSANSRLPKYLALKCYDPKIDIDDRRTARWYADFHQHLGRLAIPFARTTSPYHATKHYVLMEWMGQDLFEYCTNPKTQIRDDQLPRLIRGLEMLTTEFEQYHKHYKQAVGDVKLENIMVNTTCEGDITTMHLIDPNLPGCASGITPTYLTETEFENFIKYRDHLATPQSDWRSLSVVLGFLLANKISAEENDFEHQIVRQNGYERYIISTHNHSTSQYAPLMRAIYQHLLAGHNPFSCPMLIDAEIIEEQLKCYKEQLVKKISVVNHNICKKISCHIRAVGALIHNMREAFGSGDEEAKLEAEEAYKDWISANAHEAPGFYKTVSASLISTYLQVATSAKKPAAIGQNKKTGYEAALKP